MVEAIFVREFALLFILCCFITKDSKNIWRKSSRERVEEALKKISKKELMENCLYKEEEKR